MNVMALALGWCLVGILSVGVIGVILWLGAKVIDWRDRREQARVADRVRELEQQLHLERTKNYAVAFDERATISAEGRDYALTEVEDVLLDARSALDGFIHEIAERREGEKK